ncbi:uncharacterized protein LOC120263887 [Dioscorea cayenensis subsp. rotundata]|uniref:Uncharacterized protein LOC120263887 n=1 Tax=Dioscorea cayennensis subsp. rotundata TaxID=55577 RepID=A0AB40BKZ7_DIOCR|nr:uncharacterized protein LOC120263887 [Dioscorea cayenensis subsp. rotundata]XP_039127795.1 uncharacterized protein LOC120263887 [Dioscorea cayenensis subsp. rotundata]
MLSDERMKAMKEVGATSIKECKGMERKWIKKDVWDALLIDNEWGIDAWQSKLGKAKANRLTEKKGSITKHTGGSRPFVVHGIKLAKKQGREVGYSEIFQATHKLKGGEGEFIDNKSRVFNEKYNAALVNKYGDDISVHPSFNGQSLYDVIGGMKATRTSVYGFGSRVDSR